MPSPTNNCPKCFLPLASSDRSGSLTSFLFADMHCQCDAAALDNANRLKSDSESCKRCGKVIASARRQGSFTSFLLKDMRCSCAKPLRQSANKDAMATRFVPQGGQWSRRKQAQHTEMRSRNSSNFARDAALVKLKPGEIIGGCYRLDQLVGKGGMGVVYKASHILLGRTVALKFLAPSLVSLESWQLFQREAKINSSLTHPILCQIYDLGIHAGSLPFYAMDFIEGQTLEEIIIKNGPLSVGATLEVFIKVAEGLSYAHRRSIVHRDIKPANIMVAKRADGSPEIKLLDFGISELSDDAGKKQRDKVERAIGSAAYMSPEQFDGHDLDLRSDIYSLGCSIHETLTGNPPYEADDLQGLALKHKSEEPPLLGDTTGIAFPNALQAVLIKCLQKRKDYRYQNASELAIDLQRIRDNKELQFAKAELDQLEELEREKRVNNTAGKTLAIFVSAVAVLALIALVAVVNFNKTPTAIDPLTKIKVEESSPLEKPDKSNTKSKVVDLQAPDSLMAQVDPHPQKADRADPGPGHPTETLPVYKPDQFFLQLHQNDEGKTVNVYSFPFGDKLPVKIALYTTANGVINVFKIHACKGVLGINADQNIMLKPQDHVINIENLVPGFRKQDIKGIDLGLYFTDAPKFLRAAIDRFDLKVVILSSSQQSKESMAALAKIKTVDYLELKAWDNSGQKSNMVKIPAALEINRLELNAYKGDLKDLFELAPDKIKLTNAIIKNTQLSKQDVEFLSAVKSLRAVKLENCLLTAESLAPIFASQSIAKLTLAEATFDLENLDCRRIGSSPLEKLNLDIGQTLSTAARLKIEELKKRIKRVDLSRGDGFTSY
ncbi:MAG: serine/threonine protein kinase [Candidatus Obscuribacter sp.]|nr:serine/threonine protein kinase [Candidatus Obscuribacter sp.]MBP6595237.1 serine/threonine protein kinase [Candidatus Obscuribacter sp.]MDQ5964056.1 Non-specific serine/threonine protein kinase [Cyanobacteriota bacterium erpe_2018_sw_39hr_WHONDRS-SW48-000098_B_bin.30]